MEDSKEKIAGVETSENTEHSVASKEKLTKFIAGSDLLHLSRNSIAIWNVGA